jgi:hypothetical protein
MNDVYDMRASERTNGWTDDLPYICTKGKDEVVTDGSVAFFLSFL